ncbi:unnamed protein product, partial [Ilex paraguariensis]
MEGDLEAKEELYAQETARKISESQGLREAEKNSSAHFDENAPPLLEALSHS